MEQVWDLSFHMIVHLRLYANPIQILTYKVTLYRNKVWWFTFAKSLNRENSC